MPSVGFLKQKLYSMTHERDNDTIPRKRVRKKSCLKVGEQSEFCITTAANKEKWR